MKNYFEKLNQKFFLYFFDSNIKLWTVLETDDKKNQIGDADYYPDRKSLLKMYSFRFVPEEIFDRASEMRQRINKIAAINNFSDDSDYDYYIIAFSGGKDSTACFLHLLDIGIDKSKIELWHHLVDGKEGSTLMDWPVTEDYCRKFAEAFNVPIYFSWKEGGFEREMLRRNQPTAQNHWQYPDDNIIECGLSGGRGPVGTRRKFPQVSADLSVRWCSAYLKIDVATSAINNQPRFHNKRTVVISGERAEESAARSRYKEFEIDRADNRHGKTKRHVDRWRPVHKWTEDQVWEIIKRYKVLPHPAYRLGWGRLSCMKCIFGSNNQWATINKIDFMGLQKLMNYEKEFGVTIHRSLSISERIKKGIEYNPEYRKNGILESALSKTYKLPIFTEFWEYPAGAFGENVGPQ